MAKRNLKKVFLGIFLIVLAAFAALAAFYFLEVKPELASRQQSEFLSQESPAPAVEQPTIAEPPPRISKQPVSVKPEPVISKPTAQPLPIEPSEPTPAVAAPTPKVEAPKKTYSEAERSRRDGVLWFDRKKGHYVATLGSVHGLAAGSTLAVYSGEKRIGQVTVETSLDVISYVSPSDDSTQLTQGYYKVAIE